MIGAKIAIGIDIDQEAIATAGNTAKNMEIANSYFFTKDIYDIKEDILLKNNLANDFNLKFDILFTPSFGSQSRSKKGADRIFMELAMKSANVSYSFHMAETKEVILIFMKD